jgi:membrane-associated phospholipid phosphatase
MSALPRDVSAPVARPKQAAAEVLAGQPGPAARRWLGPTALVVFILFAIDTYLVVQNYLLPFDLPITRFIQQLNWGPVVYPMQLINASAGIWQVLLGVGAIVALFIFERRAGWLMLIGSVSSLLDNIIKLLVSRQRPPADLVHILSPSTTFSYPSGHAVFFTWMSFMIAVSIAPKVRPVYRPILWILAAMVIVLTCIARVWAGEHWPSDVLGGLLLAIGWSAFVLWLPERWLPSPSFKWFRGRGAELGVATPKDDLAAN